MTFLELCKEARKECGIQGSNQPVTVSGQSGILKRVVSWVQDADLYIQRMNTDWDFLWSEFYDESLLGSDAVSAPDDLGEWDRESFAVNRGTSEGSKLNIIDFYQWRKNQSNKENEYPSSLCVLPSGDLRFNSPSDGVYEIYANYWKAASKLEDNIDTPAYDSQFHRAIICKTKMFFFEDTEAVQLYQLAEKEFIEIIERMEKKYLPDQHKSGLTSQDIITVRAI